MTPSPEQSEAELDAQIAAAFADVFHVASSEQPMQVSSTPGPSGDTMPPSHQPKPLGNGAREALADLLDEMAQLISGDAPLPDVEEQDWLLAKLWLKGFKVVPTGALEEERIYANLRRFTRPEDLGLSDHDFVMKAFERYKRYREEPLIDPNE